MHWVHWHLLKAESYCGKKLSNRFRFRYTTTNSRGGCKIIFKCPLQGVFRVPIQDFFAKKVFFYLQKNPPPTTKKLNFWPDAWSATQKILNSLFQPNISTVGVPKRSPVGKMAIKGGVVDVTFFSKIRRSAVKRLFGFQKAFSMKNNL